VGGDDLAQPREKAALRALAAAGMPGPGFELSCAGHDEPPDNQPSRRNCSVPALTMELYGVNVGRLIRPGYPASPSRFAPMARSAAEAKWALSRGRQRGVETTTDDGLASAPGTGACLGGPG